MPRFARHDNSKGSDGSQTHELSSRAGGPGPPTSAVSSLVGVEFSPRGTCFWSTSRGGRILKAVWSGAAARLLSSALTLISLPLAVRYLGAERYGVWTTIVSTMVWINLLDLGIANTLTNHISRAFALDNKPLAARSFANALALTGGVSVIVGTAFAASFPHIDWIALFNVSGSVRAREVTSTVAVAAALTVLGLPCNLAGKILAGYQELHRNNIAICAGAVASVAGLALGILLR